MSRKGLQKSSLITRKYGKSCYWSRFIEHTEILCSLQSTYIDFSSQIIFSFSSFAIRESFLFFCCFVVGERCCQFTLCCEKHKPEREIVLRTFHFASCSAGAAFHIMWFMMLISHISFDHFGRSGDVHARDGFAVVNFICERLFSFLYHFAWSKS